MSDGLTSLTFQFGEQEKWKKTSLQTFLCRIVPFYHLRYFLQRRDFLDLIASQQGRIISGTFLSIHFSIFFRETTFLASAFGGLRESHPLSLHPRARFSFKKKRKKKKKLKINRKFRIFGKFLICFRKFDWKATHVTIFWNLARNPEKNSSKIRRKNAKFELFAIELVNIH